MTAPQTRKRLCNFPNSSCSKNPRCATSFSENFHPPLMSFSANGKIKNGPPPHGWTLCLTAHVLRNPHVYFPFPLSIQTYFGSFSSFHGPNTNFISDTNLKIEGMEPTSLRQGSTWRPSEQSHIAFLLNQLRSTSYRMIFGLDGWN